MTPFVDQRAHGQRANKETGAERLIQKTYEYCIECDADIYIILSQQAQTVSEMIERFYTT
jgi:hypothetical protein